MNVSTADDPCLDITQSTEGAQSVVVQGAPHSPRASLEDGSDSAFPRRPSPKSPRGGGKVTPKKGSLGGAASERELKLLEGVYEGGGEGAAAAAAYADALLRSGDVARAEQVCAVALAREGDKGKDHIRSIYR